MSALRLFLLPLSWPYALVLRLRHALHDSGLLKATEASVPTICVGNIALGGTGKTPHAELVLRTLLPGTALATLSRGYGRKVSGFAEVQAHDDPGTAGDEPLMLKQKFSGVRVFVGADRAAGVAAIQAAMPEVQAIVLDDALQHRAIKAGLNLVLTTWQRPWNKDHLLPAGNLRDIPFRARQADAVIVTKSPLLPTTEEQYRWRRRLGLRDAQALFFSGLEYAPPKYIAGGQGAVPVGPQAAALLFTGIADATPLAEHARSLFGTVRHIAFGDHHHFRDAELQRMADDFHSFAHGPKTLITTEKDAARLGNALRTSPLQGLPMAVIGIQAKILNEPHAFEALIRTHVATHPAHR
ncbi:MAG TPA: tetraacyldisaccharide 4'-kinase, partial [Flavobacteriales bacterium]|nr:tetraacyldisaccharide 4'-kinase [Flavobacteriales bacterium]HRP80274.1 tetraacyldisaccharide 4'-kinase [Flavobacteriales bacterium]HRQ83676.1 tetraacyldisaccharide 4'-kinase [Flavobacteriales bacterium]